MFCLWTWLLQGNNPKLRRVREPSDNFILVPSLQSAIFFMMLFYILRDIDIGIANPMSAFPSRSNPLAGRHQLVASVERSANQVTNQVKALLLNILALADSGFPVVSSPRLHIEGNDEGIFWGNCSFHWWVLSCKGKFWSDDLKKLLRTDAGEATNFLSRAILRNQRCAASPADLSGTTNDSSRTYGWVLLDQVQVPSHISRCVVWFQSKLE